MNNCSVTDLDQAMQDLRGALEGGEEVHKLYKEKYEKLKGTFAAERVGSCIDKYIAAELDHETPGARGLGRSTEHTPRLAGYFRKQMAGLSEGNRSELYKLIQSVVLRGYLSQALFAKEFVVEAKIKQAPELYEKWVPSIYAADMPPQVSNILSGVGEKAHKQLKDFLRRNNMKGGGFLSKDKTDEILGYYLLAGWMLRGIEAQGV